MDNITISHFDNDAVQEKKLGDYSWVKENFLAGQELTVTITLGEYRGLVTSKATADQSIRASNDKALKMEQEMKKAQEQAELLKAENYDLQSKLMLMRCLHPDDASSLSQDEEGCDVE